MKTEEGNLLTNSTKNKLSLNPIITYNNNCNDFKRINSSINIINTSGSQPIVIFKKISKSLIHPFTLNKIQKNDTKISGNTLRKKINKYKSELSFPNQQGSNVNTHIIKNNTNFKNIKTMRTINKKIVEKHKKEKIETKKEKTHIFETNNKNKYIKKKIALKKNDNKKREIDTKERNDLRKNKESHSHEHFNRKNKILVNNFISKSTNEIKYFNNNINNKIPNYNINIQQNNTNIKFKIKKENKKKTKEESKIAEQEEHDHKKIEYIEALIKNGVSNVSKKFKMVKKPTKKEIISKKKKDFLLENGITENLINDNNINNKTQNIYAMNNINEIKPIRKKNFAKKNCLKKSKNLNISKTNSGLISFLNNNNNNNSNINITSINNNCIESSNTNLNTNNINQETHPSNKITKKRERRILKPQINQFEFINRIQQEQKKLNTQNNKTTEKNLETNENESKLSDSFRHKNKIKNVNLNIKNFDKAKKNLSIKIQSIKYSKYSQLKNEKNKKYLEENEEDEFPFSHRKSYRSPQEIMKYLKEKRIETKKEEENTEKEKQHKAYVTFQNLLNIAKRNENYINITKIEPKINSNKLRKESNNEHLKSRKEPNEYYVGTESSKNNSTFIDKKEYYISILESKNFVNQTKISKHEEEKEKENDNNVSKKMSIEIGENHLSKNKKYMRIKNKILKKKLNKDNSSDFFDNKKNIDELYTSINKANQIFSKENLNKFRNDLLKASIDVNTTNMENIDITEETNIIKDDINLEIINNNKNENIKIEIPSQENQSSNNMINYRNKIEERLNNQNKKHNKLLSYSISFNDLNSINFSEKITNKSFHTYSKSLDKKRIFENNSEHKNIIKLIYSIKSFLTRRFFSSLHKKNNDTQKRNHYLIAFRKLIIISKIYSFKKIENYTKYFEYYEAFKELFRPFLHNRFKIFILNCYEMKIRKFILILEMFFKYKGMNKLFIYCERDFKREIINFLILTIQKPFYDYFIRKLFLFNKLRTNYLNKEIEYAQYKQKPILEKVIYYEENNIFNCEQNYNYNPELNNKATDIILIKHGNEDNNENEIKNYIRIKEYLNIDNPGNSNETINKDYLMKLTEIKNPELLAEELSDILVRKIVNSELKLFSPFENIIPYKTFKYNFLPKSQNGSLNNSYISSSCASLDQISLSNNYSNLNESMLSQTSFYSEFNKTIKDKKREQAMNFYNKKIGPKLIQLICDEIKNNYIRIFKNIETPLQTNFKEIVIALELKDNEQLKRNYRILKVNEQLKDIINKEKIIKKFEKTNKKIRKKYNQNNIDENFDLFMNLNLIDTAIELINKERFYGETGEPFAYNSIRTRCIGYKYQENNYKKLVDYISKNLYEYLNNPIFLINDNIVNADEKNIIKYFKKDLEENEEQWQDMEIVETQSKLEVTELILEQLYNEIIEILEHVQLNRKRPELYQEKSIYASEDIPKLSFQQTTTENENLIEGFGKN